MKIHKQNRDNHERRKDRWFSLCWLRFSRLLGKTAAISIGFVPNDTLSGLEIICDLKIGHKEEYINIS